MSKNNDSAIVELAVKLIKLPINIALAAVALVIDLASGLGDDGIGYVKALAATAVEAVGSAAEYVQCVFGSVVEVWDHTADLAGSIWGRVKDAVSSAVSTITENL